MKKLFCLLGLAVVMAASGFLSWASDRGEPLFTLVQLTDIHYTVTPPETSPLSWKHHLRIFGYRLHRLNLAQVSPILRNTLAYINEKIKPDLVVVTGDMVNRVDDKESMKQVKKWLDTLDVPYHPLMGDRELTGGPDKGKNYREVFGEINYAFDYKGWQIIMLGVHPDDEALAWLRSTLKENADKPAILCIHQMLIASPLMKWLARRFHHGVELISPRADEIIDIINNYGRVKAVLSGHSHTNYQVRRDGILYISTASLTNIPYQFRVIRVYKDRISTFVTTAHPLKKR